MQLLTLILVGFLIGFLAKLVMPGTGPNGFMITILLGIAGSFVGGYVGKILQSANGRSASFLLAVVGAMLLLGIYRLTMKVERQQPVEKQM